MKILYTLIFTVLITMQLPAGEETLRIAKVDYSAIDDLLESIILNSPENKDLAVKFRANAEKSREQQAKMQKAIMSGEKVNPMDMAQEAMGDSSARDVTKKVELKCEKYLLNIVEKIFKDKYDVILKDSYRSSMLYTKIAIDDVTDVLRQELLKYSK